MSDLTAYLSTLNTLISRRNGKQLGKAMALPLSGEVPVAVRQFVATIKRLNVVSACENKLADQSIASIVANRLLALVAFLDSDYDMAYRHENTAYNAAVDYFAQKDEQVMWIIPVMNKLANDLRILAERADEKTGDINNKVLRESLSTLTRGFTVMAKDRTPVVQADSKKRAIFSITNVLFKIYFKVNTLQLCWKLVNVVEGPGAVMENLTVFPVCDVAMYKYYVGRLKMFEDRYEDARESLSFALKYCPKSNIKNRQRVLASLVPIQMCLGIMPSPAVGSVYGLTELCALSDAVKKGDIGSFNRLMQAHQASFIKIGVYLVLEQVKVILHRNLSKRLHALSNTTRLNLNTFEVAYRWLGEQDIDLDEIECILANLIYNNKIKGYISHQKRFLVVSKTDPFPNMNKKSKT